MQKPMYGMPPKPRMMPPPRKMAADGDLGAPSDMDSPGSPTPDESEGSDEATLETINKKLDAIMEALQIQMPDEQPPADVGAGADMGNTRAGNPEMQP